tara:strand:+ start:664 stop:855 length:192 start_codon:yes stop_codon:yes gene_type:complete
MSTFSFLTKSTSYYKVEVEADNLEDAYSKADSFDYLSGDSDYQELEQRDHEVLEQIQWEEFVV